MSSFLNFFHVDLILAEIGLVFKLFFRSLAYSPYAQSTGKGRQNI
jgi:hypothetical protein